MSASRLPALRMAAPENPAIALDIPPTNKFSVSYAPSEVRAPTTAIDAPGLTDDGGDSMGSSPDVSDEGEDTVHLSSQVQHHPGSTSMAMSSIPETSGPHMSRTLSMPLPSQLSHLQNPHRPGPSNSHYSSPHVPSVTSIVSSQVREVSLELADSIQLVIQTMLQISPPQVLDTAKEQFSACALSVPTSSMSAMFTAMKNINYISAHMSSFCDDAPLLHKHVDGENPDHNEFDVGEMLQCTGDALSGAASQAGVDLVLYHGDVGLKNIYVSANESAISFGLSHIIRQVLNTAERGDSIEIGLLVGTVVPHEVPPVIDDLDDADSPLGSGPIPVTIRISHRYAPSDTQRTTEDRPKPMFSTLFLRRILRQIGGNLVSDLPPPDSFTDGRTCELELVLDRVIAPIQSSPEMEEGENVEPTIEQLSTFGETLKGKRVSLYAHAKGSFAHHLTSYLTAWGMDVTHVSRDGQVDGTPEQQDNSPAQQFSPPASYTEPAATITAPAVPEANPVEPPPPSSLIFIDDDVDVLKERLQALRYETQTSTYSRKRPSLAAHHRPRSSPQMARLLNTNNLARPSTPVVIMHFTGLSNYKLLKDVMQSITASYAATATPLPEVMIIPKPAGPRRFLTALYTAITKPTVDPFFMPIATSPMSPTLGYPNSYIPSTISERESHAGNSVSLAGSAAGSQSQSPLIKGTNRPLGSRTNSDRSSKSFDAGPPVPPPPLPPSPLAISDNVEYFSAAAQKLGASPSSGLVIQSPDGQTAGIYFHPRSKAASRNPSKTGTEGDRVQVGLSATRQRGSVPRVPSGGKKEDISFAALHELALEGKARKGEEKPALSPRSSTGTSVQSVTAAATALATVPAGIASGSPSPILPSPKVITIAPTEEQHQQQQIQPPISSSSAMSPSTGSPVSRKGTDDTRKAASPTASTTALPENGGAAATPMNIRRAKRLQAEKQDAAASISGKPRAKNLLGGSDNVIPPISVLIVDDNPINQTILSTFMRRKKIKYDLASNGQEAVQKWRTGGFHLILMDIQMPVMDGIQATKEIRSLEKANASTGYPLPSPSIEEGRTPSEASAPSVTSSTENRSLNSPYRSSVIIVALTASSLQSDRVAALAAGCNDFLTKPVSLLWLNNKIIEWGSIKALQMWADIRPDAVRSLVSGQAQQARNVAERLHVPKGRTTPSRSPSRRNTGPSEEEKDAGNAAALALASSGGPLGISGLNPPISPTASSFKSRDGSPHSSNAAHPNGDSVKSSPSNENGPDSTVHVVDFATSKKSTESSDTSHITRPSRAGVPPSGEKTRSLTPTGRSMHSTIPQVIPHGDSSTSASATVKTRENGTAEHAVEAANGHLTTPDEVHSHQPQPTPEDADP